MFKNICASCGQVARFDCAGCKSVSYCNKKCQTEHWQDHKLYCDSRSDKVTTADRLAHAVRKNVQITDEETLKDYGFFSLSTANDRTILFGLYRALIVNMKTTPKTIHQWRVSGMLVQEIKVALEEFPPAWQEYFCPWFLKNEGVLEKGPEPGNMSDMRAWIFAGGSPSSSGPDMSAEVSSWPMEKAQCYALIYHIYTGLRPTVISPIWLTFGFGVGDERIQQVVTHLYTRLFSEGKCTFDELYDAYRSSALIRLFDSKGFKDARSAIPHFDDIVSLSPHGCKLVWCLKRYIAANDERAVGISRPVARLYGFANCHENSKDKIELRTIYAAFFHRKDADPLALHDAAMHGRLFDYLQRFVGLRKKHRKLLKPVSPVQNYEYFGAPDAFNMDDLKELVKEWSMMQKRGSP